MNKSTKWKGVKYIRPPYNTDLLVHLWEPSVTEVLRLVVRKPSDGDTFPEHDIWLVPGCEQFLEANVNPPAGIRPIRDSDIWLEIPTLPWTEKDVTP